MKHRPLLAGFAAAALVLSPLATWAGSFTISPLRVEFSRQTGTAALTVRNEEQTEVIVQASAMLWEQAQGKDALTPTRDVLVSPAVFTLPPGGSQLVRVALRRAPDATRELSYRLLIDEVPPPAAADFQGLQLALRLSLPIFVAPLQAATTAVQWSAARSPDGDLSVTARNSGTNHVQVKELTLAPREAPDKALRHNLSGYVLPGQSRSWALEYTAEASRRWTQVRMTGITDQGEVAAELDLPAR